MAAIHQQIAAVDRRLADLTRFAARRENHLDMLDWDMMSGRFCIDSLIDDMAIEEDLAAAHMELEHLHGMEILGFTSRYDQVPFDPDMPFCMGRPVQH